MQELLFYLGVWVGELAAAVVGVTPLAVLITTASPWPAAGSTALSYRQVRSAATRA